MKFFKKSDVIIVLAIILTGMTTWAVYNYFFRNKPGKAEIYYENRLVMTIDLNTGVDRKFSIPQDEHVIFHLYEDGKICFEESDCPDKICVKTGKLHLPGETAACLPNKIILKIIPAKGRTGNLPELITR